MSDIIDPKKLKVAELREELKARGLDTKGNKAQLVKRLKAALSADLGDDAPDDLNDSTVTDSTAEESFTEQSQPEADAAPVAEPEPEPEQQPAAEEPRAESEPAYEEPKEEAEPEPQAEPEPEPAAEPEPEPEPEAEPEPEPQQEEMQDEPQVEDEQPPTEESPMPEAEQPAAAEEPVKESEPAPEVQKVVEQEQEPTEQAPAETNGDESASSAMEQESAPEAQQTEAETEQPMESEAQAQPEHDQAKTVEPDQEQRGEKRRHPDDQSHHRRHRSRGSRSRSRSPRRRRSRSPHRRTSDDRSRSRSRERDRHHHRSRSPLPRNAVMMESDDWLNAETVQLDRYNCDLNIRISDNGVKANPITVEGFAFMWAGVRAMYGVTQGKVCFEMKILEHLNVDHLPSEETSRHVVRIGFSTDDTSMQLGEEKNSWGYGGTAKSSVDNKFEDYGQKFEEGDVIGAYLDLDSETGEISFTKNGEDLGKAFDVDKAELDGKALFPHVLTKNCEFELNFGAREEPYFPIKEGYEFMNSVPAESRVRGSIPPEKKEDCEMIMLSGLPGSGKTYWATKYALEFPEKKFNVLGTNTIIDKMKVMGLPRKRNYEGRWDTLIDKATKCLTRLFEIAAKKKRNYILDQTNVYPSAQRRKMRPFEGFQRRAVVIVPTDEEFKKRCEKREQEEGKDVPDTAVLEMKANFQLPEEGQIFDKVEFIELDREEAQKLVEQYNKEGRDALPPPDKRFHEGRDRYGGGRDYRGGYGGGGGYNRDRGGRGGYGNYRGGYDRRGGGRGGYNQRGGYMGYSNRDRERVQGRRDNRDDRRSVSRGHDNRSSGARSYDNHWKNSGSWGGNQGSWGNQGNWNNQGNSWGNQGNWGSNQGYNNQGWGQYQQGQNWGQNYNYNQGSWGNWSGYNQNQSQQGQGSSSSNWGNYNYNNYNQGGNQSGQQRK